MDAEFRDLERRYMAARQRLGLPPLVPPPNEEQVLALLRQVRCAAAVSWREWWRSVDAWAAVRFPGPEIKAGDPIVLEDGQLKKGAPNEPAIGIVQDVIHDSVVIEIDPTLYGPDNAD